MNYEDRKEVEKIAREERDGGVAAFFAVFLFMATTFLVYKTDSRQEDKIKALEVRVHLLENRK